jgi:hypothetical protein
MPKASTAAVSLIKPQARDEKERITIAISAERARELKTYAKFLGDSEVSYVVDQALAYLFSRDRAYQSWQKSGATAHATESPSTEPSKSGRKKAGEPASTPAA